MRSFNRHLITFIILNAFVFTSFAQSANTCPDGFYWSSQLNRCLISSQSADAKEEAAQCSGLTGNAYRNCFNNAAQAGVRDLEQKEGLSTYDKEMTKSDGRLWIAGTTSFIAGYYLLQNKSKFQNCKSTSIWLLLSAGMVSFIGELTAREKFKKDTKNLEDEYKEQMKEYEGVDQIALATDNQKVAFDLLIAGNQARHDAEKIRKNTYLLAETLYGAALVAAIVEGIQAHSWVDTCNVVNTSTDHSKNKYSQKHYDDLRLLTNEFDGYAHIKDMTSKEFLEIIMRKIYNQVLPSAHANTIREDPDPLDGIQDKIQEASKAVKNDPAGLINSSMAKKQMKWYDRALTNPIVRGVMATSLGIYSEILRSNAKENMETALERIEAIEKIRDGFVGSGGAGFSLCSSEQRNDPNQPRCFCYNEDGSKDISKSRLSACTKVFAKNDFKQANDYRKLLGGTYANANICLTKKGQADYACKCKKKNDCLKISSKINLGSAGGSWLKSLSTPIDNIFSGKMNSNDLDTTKLNNMAMKIKKKLGSMEKDSKYKESLLKIKSMDGKFQKANEKWYKKSFGNSVPRSLASSGLGAKINTSAPKTAADVVEQAKDQIKKSSEKFIKGKTLGDSGSQNSQNKDALDFNWDSDDESQGGTQVSEFASIMDKNYAITGDINKNSSQDIFKILSIRYQRSALRRLFDVEGKSSADAANETDINEQ